MVEQTVSPSADQIGQHVALEMLAAVGVQEPAGEQLGGLGRVWLLEQGAEILFQGVEGGQGRVVPADRPELAGRKASSIFLR